MIVRQCHAVSCVAADGEVQDYTSKTLQEVSFVCVLLVQSSPLTGLCGSRERSVAASCSSHNLARPVQSYELRRRCLWPSARYPPGQTSLASPTHSFHYNSRCKHSSQSKPEFEPTRRLVIIVCRHQACVILNMTGSSPAYPVLFIRDISLVLNEFAFYSSPHRSKNILRRRKK